MDWKNQLTKTPYLVLFIVLISIGVGTASALIIITLSGDVIITGNTELQGDLTCTNCIDATDINLAEVQQRSGGMTCPADFVINGINQNGSIDCWPSFTGEDSSGIPGVIGMYTREITFDGFSTGDNNIGLAIACDTGDFALSGGVADDNAGTPDEFVVKEFGNGEVENFGSNLWVVTVDFKSDSIEGLGITLHVVCLDFSPAHT